MVRKPLSVYYDLVKQIDRWPYLQDTDSYHAQMKDYYYFMVEGFDNPLGYIHESKVKQIQWPEFWTINDQKRLLTLARGSGLEARSEMMANTLQQEHERGEVSDVQKLSQEICAVNSVDNEVVLRMDRSAAGLFGIRTYGVFLIAYVKTDEGPKFWVAQRSKTKMTYAGKLDMCVGGSLRADEAPIDCLVREGEEEASLSAAFTRKAVQAVGALTYHMAIDDHGQPASRAQTQYVYELEVPADMIPKPCDNEVENFSLMSLEEIKDALKNERFKLNIAMTWIDYLIRHGHVHSENEEKYLEIGTRLHRNLDFFIL